MNCGQKLPESAPAPVTESEVPAAPVCPACGAPIKAGDLFCMNCGQKVPESAPTAVPVASSESTSESSSSAPVAESEAPEAAEADAAVPEAVPEPDLSQPAEPEASPAPTSAFETVAAVEDFDKPAAADEGHSPFYAEDSEPISIGNQNPAAPVESVPPAAAPTVCPNCGEALEADDLFCTNCGTKIADDKPAPKQDRSCPSCGKQVHGEDAFCPYCGGKLN